MNKIDKSFESLVWQYLDQEISPDDFTILQELLADSAEHRLHYQHLVEIHNGLLMRGQSTPHENIDRVNAYDVLMEQKSARHPFRLAWVAAAAAIALLLTFFPWADFGQQLDVQYVALRDTDIRGSQITEGDFANTQMIHLMRGAVALEFPTKTTAIIEGPAWYQVDSDGSIVVSSGTITIHHEGAPGTFKVTTPLGDLVDMGTKFGVTIGNGITNSAVITEVYEGEVIYDHPEKPLSMQQGDAYAIVGNNKEQSIRSDLGGRPVKVTGTFTLNKGQQNLKLKENLALGKPVTASSYYSQTSNGEVFGPENLTDNRMADSGSPWNWSFWLAKNGEAGAVTIDLLELHNISRVSIQNTRNRHFNDRGLKDILIEVSADGNEFHLVQEATLAQIHSQSPEAFAFENFSFDPIEARYVRITGTSYYHAHGGNGSGGLNEVQVFE